MHPSPALQELARRAAERGEAMRHAVHHHLLEGLLRRIARAADGEGFVLRGGLLTRAWLAPRPRPTRDLDLVGDFSYDLRETTRRFQAVLEEQVEDGIGFSAERMGAQGIWLDTEFPGVRVTVGARLGDAPVGELTVDIGFGDPLVPEAQWLVYPALQEQPPARVRACRPETMAAWKLHGLCERGASWRPKDLVDLWLIVQHVPLEAALLPAAFEAAFQSRGFTMQQAAGTLEMPHWSTKSARVRWATAQQGEELGSVLAALRVALAPSLKG